MKKIKLLIVDDHSLIRSGIKNMLSDNNDIEIIGEAENGIEAVNKTEELNPDVVLMDNSMPGISGLDATFQIKQKFPEVNILILTINENEEYIFSSLKKGASGLLNKNITKDELINGIKSVAKDKKYFGSSISRFMIENYMERYSFDNIEEENDFSFTRREKEVLKFIAEGLSNKEIGEKLNISPRTVDTHKGNLLQKLNLKSTASLSKFAYEYSRRKKK